MRTWFAPRAISDGRPPHSRIEERPPHSCSEERPPHYRRQSIHQPAPETRHPSTHYHRHQSTHHPSTHYHRKHPDNKHPETPCIHRASPQLDHQVRLR